MLRTRGSIQTLQRNLASLAFYFRNPDHAFSHLYQLKRSLSMIHLETSQQLNNHSALEMMETILDPPKRCWENQTPYKKALQFIQEILFIGHMSSHP